MPSRLVILMRINEHPGSTLPHMPMQPYAPMPMTFQPCVLIAFVKGLCLSYFVLMTWLINQSCVNVSPILRFGVGMSGPICSSGIFLYVHYI